MSIRTGIFIAPFHAALHQDPTLAIRGDLDLISLVEDLGFDEAWVGEHHSGGAEIIMSPELLLAAAVERTSRITLGTGVISLPYHNPLMAADRMIQLDHQARGRVVFGVGPGLLASDADMLNIPTTEQRDRMQEALEIILRLFDGETVTDKSSWFELNQARCQLRPYSRPRPRMAAATVGTPFGAKLAGRHGLELLCFTIPASLNGIRDANWDVACQEAAQAGRTMDRDVLRLVGPMHIAETREQALEDLRYGLRHFLDYLSVTMSIETPQTDDPEALAQVALSFFEGVIGTPDDAIAYLERMQERSGGYGTFLQLAHDWASPEATRKSLELFARYVKPALNDATTSRTTALRTYGQRSAEMLAKMQAGTNAAIARHEAEQQQKTKG